MGIFGHIMKFIMIIIVAILVILTLVCGAMFLFPSIQIFGYHYIKSGVNNGFYEKVSGETAKAQQAWDDADIVRFEISGYNLSFDYATSEMLFDDHDIRVQVSGQYRGFVKGSVDRPTYSSTNTTFNAEDANPYNSYYKDPTRPDKKIYFIKMQEPEKGFMLRTQNSMTVTLTYDAFKNKDVEIIAKGGNVEFGTAGKMSANNIRIESESGSVTFGETEIATYEEAGIEKAGNIDITKSKKGKVVFNNDIKANVNIEVNGGTDVVSLKNVLSTGTSASKLSVKNHNGSVYVGNVFGDFSCDTKGAKMVVGDITGTTRLVVKETACQFGTIGVTPQVDTLSLEATGKTTITFDKVFSKIDMGKNTGTTITVKESYGDVLYGVGTGKGTLNLKNVHASKINIVSSSGKINIDAKPEERVDIESTATAGTISFTGIKLGTVKINKANEFSSCNINGSFVEVHGDNIIKTTSGKVSISAPHSDNYSLAWESAKASLDIFGNAKTTINTSKKYCESQGESFRCTTAFGQPCDEKYDYIDLLATTGTITVSEYVAA